MVLCATWYWEASLSGKALVRKYNISQKVRVKTNNGGHKPPPNDIKGSLGTIAQQSTSNWLENCEAVPPESPPSYYVDFEEGHTELVGEEWLEAV